MKKKCIFIVFCIFAASSVISASPPAYAPEPGPYSVKSLDFDWHDADRSRDVPVRIYYPADANAPVPLILFSHGLGGTRKGYAYLSQHWASHGYVIIHPQHIHSDESVWKGKADPMEEMKKATRHPTEYLDRAKDVSFCIDQALSLNADHPEFKGLVNPARIGIAGHSFGSHTTMLIAGQQVPRLFGRTVSARDARVTAAVAMSSPVPANPRQYEKAYAGVAIPVLHMTGTLDVSAVSDTTAEQRRIPFDYTLRGERMLVTFIDGDHSIFSGRSFRQARPLDDIFHDLILQTTTAFWDAHLKNDIDAHAWLSLFCADVLADYAVVESALPID